VVIVLELLSVVLVFVKVIILERNRYYMTIIFMLL